MPKNGIEEDRGSNPPRRGKVSLNHKSKNANSKRGATRNTRPPTEGGVKSKGKIKTRQVRGRLRAVILLRKKNQKRKGGKIIKRI